MHCDTLREVDLDELLWDEESAAHITRHGVSQEEVEQVVFDEASMRGPTHHPMRQMLVGLTEEGRFLTVIVARVAERQGRCVTARDASKKERSVYKQWRSTT